MNRIPSFESEQRQQLQEKSLEGRLGALEDEVAQQNRTITGLQEILLKVARYHNEDPEKHIQGIQILLGKAGEYTGRARKRR